MKKFIKLLFLATLIFSVATLTAGSKLSITNQSTWKIEVTYIKNNKEITKTLEPNGDSFTLGEKGTFSDVSIKPYGRVFGYFGVPNKIDLNSLSYFPEYDADIKITTQWGKWQFTELPLTAHGKAELPKSGDPYDAFPGARRARQLGRTILPRHILGVPENAKLNDITAAYRKLSVQWHPDKHPENPQLATEISKILNNAYEDLKK